jgi:four helix bundle protein
LPKGSASSVQSRTEFHRFVAMAIGSADEMQVWTLYARDLGYIGADVAERWQGEYREIARMLQGLSRRSSDP